MKTHNDIVIIYHKDCRDGFGGAWAAWKKFRNNARYIAYRHGDEPITDVDDRVVYFIDLAYKKPVLEAMKQRNKRLIIIDHHKTNADVMGLADESSFAMEHSGAVLAWNYFHPKIAMPKMLRYIEDDDLGKWLLPHTKELSAFLSAQPYDFAAFNKLASTFERVEGRASAIEKGKVLLAREAGMVEEVIRDATTVEFEGYRCRAANSSLLHSEIGGALARRYPPIGIVWSERADKKRVSLRSVGDVDVAAIAQKYGGGGHKNAAAFTLPRTVPLPWRPVNE